ncbi:MAG TPA: FHA domain-containing protein [Tepidisphaeraceae bacterium]|jgi:predicted component of type VI protein secretion system
MNVVLVMFRENGDRRSFSLTRDVTVIGRREDADFRIPLTDVSRKHCRLVKEGNYLVVEDLGSANGTYLNGQRVTDAELNPGDTLQIGPVQFLVQIDGLPHDEELPSHNTMAGRAVALGAADGVGTMAAPSLPPQPPLELSDAPSMPQFPPVPMTTPVHKLAPNAPTIDETPEEAGEILDAADELEEISEEGELVEDPTDLVEVNDDIIFDDTAHDAGNPDDVIIDFGDDKKA